MKKKNNNIFIFGVLVVITLLVLGLTLYFGTKKDKENVSTDAIKFKKEYEKYNNKEAGNGYKYPKVTLDDNNKLYYAKSGDTAYTDTTYNGSESKYVIKDGNSYLLMDESKKYYTYANNTIDLNLVIDTLEKLKEEEHQDGEEQIDGKNYNYEEYSTITELAISDFSENTSNAKTRLYFQGDKLVYIKTIAGDKQELLKVETTYKVDNQLFNIPSDYAEG